MRLRATAFAQYGEVGQSWPIFDLPGDDDDDDDEGAKDCEQGVCQSMDEHWKPFYAGCSYCDLQYDYISKVSQIDGL